MQTARRNLSGARIANTENKAYCQTDTCGAESMSFIENRIGSVLTGKGRKVGEVGMKEITFPVLVLDDDCRTCEELDIVSDTRTRMYADNECISQDTLVRCSNVYRCMKIQKRLENRRE